jgi:hypothetical protein
MISSTQILGFLMLPLGRKGQRGVHSLICSLGEIQREQEDELSDIGRGELGYLLAWRAHGDLVPSLFIEELPVLRRAHLVRRAHHQ